MKIQIISVIAAAGLLAGCAENRRETTSTSEPQTGVRDRGADVTVTTPSPQLSDLPAPVQATVRAHAGAAEIADIDRETREGMVIYEISFKEPGKNPKIHVAADGTLMESDLSKRSEAVGTPGAPTQVGQGELKIGTKLSDLPAAVLKTIQERVPNAEVADIDKETRDGRVVYEISFKDEGKNPKLHVAEDGTIVEDLKK